MRKRKIQTGAIMENNNNILFAVFYGDQEITDEIFEEVKLFAAYVAQHEKLARTSSSSGISFDKW